MSKRVLVCMSGGVDSSVTAYLLKKEGFDVIGVFIRNGVEVKNSTQQSCCSVDDSYDARRVADALGIPFYSINQKDNFNGIISYFIDEYNKGRTPNPCAVCNRQIKFGSVFDYADTLNCEFVATGHYARLGLDSSGKPMLKKGMDPKKDQSYFLFDIKKERLNRIMFPIGGMTKEQIRTIASDAKLPVMNKPESQEVCFVPGNDYRDLLRKYNVNMKEGEIKMSNGKVVGNHKGHQMYTIGQREGLGIAIGKPLYVVEIVPETNTVVIGDNDELLKSSFNVSDVNWLCDLTPDNFNATVKIRYNHAGEDATINVTGASACTVKMRSPTRAITPGQAAVFYKDDVVLGGGWIDKISI